MREFKVKSMQDESQDNTAAEDNEADTLADTLEPQLEAADAAAAAEEEAAAEAENDEPSEASKAIAALGLTRMSLQELKDKPPVDLLAFAEQLDIENANSMRKQDMMFAILKTLDRKSVV